jgi:hypothetical protein
MGLSDRLARRMEQQLAEPATVKVKEFREYFNKIKANNPAFRTQYKTFMSSTHLADKIYQKGGTDYLLEEDVEKALSGWVKNRLKKKPKARDNKALSDMRSAQLAFTKISRDIIDEAGDRAAASEILSKNRMKGSSRQTYLQQREAIMAIAKGENKSRFAEAADKYAEEKASYAKIIAARKKSR